LSEGEREKTSQPTNGNWKVRERRKTAVRAAVKGGKREKKRKMILFGNEV
jgi:hypothetical protein